MGLKIDLGHVLSIGVFVIGIAVSHGSTSADSARVKQDLMKQVENQERMLREIHDLSILVVRTQTQMEDWRREQVIANEGDRARVRR